MSNIDLTALIIQYVAGKYLAEEDEMSDPEYDGWFHRHNEQIWTTLSI